MVRSLPMLGIFLALTACGSSEAARRLDVTPTITLALPATTAQTTLPGTTAAASVTIPQNTDSAEEMPVTSSDTQPPVSPDPSSSNSLVELAIADLRAMVGDDGDITVISQAEIVWPDGALGCPEPGMSYTQALVDGSRIVLGYEGVEYAYHSGRNAAPFYCPPMRLQDAAEYPNPGH